MYNTGNPIGSTAPKDFSDNAEIADRYVNDVVNETTQDRFGRSRLTLHGIEKKADAVFASVGFFVPVDYAAGLSVDSRNFTVTYNGIVYAAQPSAVPFTTGAWDAAHWYPIQNVLNQKNLLVFDTYAEAYAAAATLPDGQAIEIKSDETRDGRRVRYVVVSSALVFDEYLDGFKVFETAADLRASAGDKDGELAELVSYHDGWAATVRGATGGGAFYWNASSTEPDDGGMVFAVYGVATGRWKRRIEGNTLWIDWFGAVRDQDATNAIKSAIAYLSSIGGGVLRASGRYLLDTENIKIDNDNILIEGDGPGLTIFERTNPGIALFMFQWAFTNNTTGGGLLNCELIGVRNPTTGNGALAFGTDVNYANFYQLKNVVVRKWGQYGVGIYNGNNWDIDRVYVFEHGHTSAAIGSCVAFNVFPRLISANGRLRNIYAVIGSGSLANSAAIKLEQHQNLDAHGIYASGGTEINLSISAIGGKVSGVKCVSQGSYPGIALASRDPAVSTLVGRFSIDDVDCDDAGFSVSMVIGAGSGAEASLEDCNVSQVRAAQFRVNNAASMKNCEFNDIKCSVGFNLDHSDAGVAPPNIRPTNNKFVNVRGGSFRYQGDNSTAVACAVNGGATIRGDGNTVKSLHSQGSLENGVVVAGSNNKFFDLSISLAANASVFIQSGSNNKFHGISYNPAGYHVADSGTGSKFENLIQLV